MLSLGSVAAQVATFQVDPAVSSLTVSGTVVGAPIQQQAPGSLTTTYQGPLLVQLAPGSIQFVGGSDVTANNSGSWQPLPGGEPGSAPANYGGRVVILLTTSLAAVRDAIFDGTTPAPLALSGGNSATFSSAIDFTATDGTIDYNSPLAGNGTQTIVGEMGTNAAPDPGLLSIGPGAPGVADATLTLPISFTITTDLGGFGDGVFNFIGSTTASASARAGDANFDGVVNLLDFNTLASNFGTQTGGTWLGADFNFDGRVNLEDFNLLAGNFGLSASPAGPTPGDWTTLASVVPESSVCWIVPLAGLAAHRRAKRA